MSNLSWNEEATTKTPGINFDSENNRLIIEGKLIPEDPKIFFNKLYDWLNLFLMSPVNSVEFDLYLYYYNTSSLKRLVIFFDQLERALRKSHKKVRINWRCDQADEDNIADGKDFQNMFSLDINIVEVPDEV